MEAKTKNENLDRVSEAVDKVLRRILGREATLLIYEYLETKYGVRKSEIAEKIDVFAKGLEDFLRSGAYVIEMKILEDIYSRHNSLYKAELGEIRAQYDFVDQVKRLM